MTDKDRDRPTGPGADIDTGRDRKISGTPEPTGPGGDIDKTTGPGGDIDDDRDDD